MFCWEILSRLFQNLFFVVVVESNKVAQFKSFIHRTQKLPLHVHYLWAPFLGNLVYGNCTRFGDVVNTVYRLKMLWVTEKNPPKTKHCRCDEIIMVKYLTVCVHVWGWTRVPGWVEWQEKSQMTACAPFSALPPNPHEKLQQWHTCTTRRNMRLIGTFWNKG